MPSLDTTARLKYALPGLTALLTGDTHDAWQVDPDGTGVINYEQYVNLAAHGTAGAGQRAGK